jgi:nucleoside-diphosphate-sugar epimerase
VAPLAPAISPVRTWADGATVRGMTRIFIAGATGVIGQRLVPRLLLEGHDVTAMTRRPAAAAHLEALGAQVAVADAFDRDTVRAAVAGARPDVVIHQLTDLTGGSSDANAALRTQGTRNLVDAALAAGVRRVVAQSIAWAYAPGADPADEAVPLDPRAATPRATTVAGIAALEAAVREAPEWVLLRYGALYGRGTFFARDGARGLDARAGALTATADLTSFVHVDDAAVAAVEALAWPSGAVNVCDDDPAPGYEWVPEFCRAVGADPPPVRVAPRAEWARGATNRHAREDLGWVPRHPSWRSGFTARPQAPGAPAPSAS